MILPNSKIVNDVVRQILSLSISEERNHNETFILDMSSSFPPDTQANARKANEIGIHFLDAPVSGGVKKAVSGELTIMVGGDEDAFHRQLSILQTFGKNIFYLGESGSGHLVKFLNNYLSAVHMLATSEAVRIIANFGINPQAAIDVFNRSSGRSGSTEYKFPEFVLRETYNSGFSLDLLAKDIDITRQLLEKTGDATLLVKLISDTYHAASRSLRVNADHTEIFRYVSAYIQNKF